MLNTALCHRLLLCALLLSFVQPCFSSARNSGIIEVAQAKTPSQPSASNATGTSPTSAPASSTNPVASRSPSPSPSPSPTPCTASSPSSEASLISCPESLSFEAVINDTSSAKTVTLINNSTAALTVNYTIAPGNFKADNLCQGIAAGGSCSITITFTPTHTDPTYGALNFTASPTTKMPHSVTLVGVGRQKCQALGFKWDSGVTALVVIAGLYFLGFVLVRWHMIAKPARAQLVAQIKAIWSWVESAPLSSPPQGGIEQIRQLLNFAARPFNSRKIRVTIDPDLAPLPRMTRLFNAIFWTRGAELAGWSCAHEAEQQMAALLPEERVRAWMETAEAELRQFKTDEADAMAKRLNDSLQAAPPKQLESLQALLIEALGLIYNQRDNEYSMLADWHNKMIWLIVCALVFIVAVGLVFQNAVLMLVGAVGGLLSRLTQNLQAAEAPHDYGTSWGSLFLSPLTGALAAWGGILLMILAARLQILGSVLTFDWCNPYQPVTLAVALMLGFTERLFDDLVTQIEPKLLPSSTTPMPAPTIVSVTPSPNPAKIGQLNTLTVHGANFQSGISASVTDENGNPVTATAAYQDPTTITVSFTPPLSSPPATAAYNSTLTVINPDKKSAKFLFQIAP